MFILVRQTICGAMLIRVGKLQFICLTRMNINEKNNVHSR